jgi:cation transport ATPase
MSIPAAPNTAPNTAVTPVISAARVQSQIRRGPVSSIGEKPKPPAPVPGGVIYICPMQGLTGTVESHKLAIGNAAFLGASGISTADLAKDTDELRKDGATVIFMGLVGKAAGSSPSPIR